jgi:hypothetical protein
VNPAALETWNGNWAWGLPLIALCTVIHVFFLGLLNERFIWAMSLVRGRRGFVTVFALVMSLAVTVITLLHGLEAAIWAGSYFLLGALPDARSASLYSLSAITTYGHEELHLAEHWRMMGALEALNGMILFGLTTAFLFSMIQRVWPLPRWARDRVAAMERRELERLEHRH